MAPAGSPGSEPDTSRGDSRPFVCGVVEGFYGRPWTLVQRKDLFDKMQCWGMGSYLYAPKDDCKHRAFWRELYTVEEADHLQSLITAASDCNVDFYYAISPGLDITYSNSKEVRSLDQDPELLYIHHGNIGGHTQEETRPGGAVGLQSLCSSVR